MFADRALCAVISICLAMHAYLTVLIFLSILSTSSQWRPTISNRHSYQQRVQSMISIIASKEKMKSVISYSYDLSKPHFWICGKQKIKPHCFLRRISLFQSCLLQKIMFSTPISREQALNALDKLYVSCPLYLIPKRLVIEMRLYSISFILESQQASSLRLMACVEKT